jgi:hypothetical protein
VEGCCEHDNEPSGSTKHWEILEYLKDCWLVNKNSDLWEWLAVT